MVDIASHEKKLADARAELKRSTGFHRKDVQKHIRRLERELRECRMFMRR